MFSHAKSAKMLEMMLQRSAGGSAYQASKANLVMAMDFDTGWVDLANAQRTFAIPSNGSLSTAMKINGAQSYLHNQTYAGGSQILTTPRTADLTFAGDFWVEMWGYCLGQGSETFTGGSNYLFTYGKYTVTGLQGLWLNYLRLSFTMPSGTGGAVVAQSTVLAQNNAWQHFAVGRKDGKLYLFLNGKIVASATYTDVVGFDNVLGIGGYVDGRLGTQASYAGFNGYLDRVRVYNTCLATKDFTPLVTPF
jgi:hypothetical protein